MAILDRIDGREMYFIVLIVGMVSMVATFNMDMELVSAGIVIATVLLLILIKSRSDRPVFDERDISLAEESTHQAVMWTGVLGGAVMIVISIGMGLGRWDYPEWIAPYYLAWGGIIGLSIAIEVLKRYRVIK
jgi:uncharacterized membrane protein